MENYLVYVSLTFFVLYGCISFNTGSLETQRFDHNKNFRIVGAISGSSTANYVLGMGGGINKGSFIKAKEDMYGKYIFKENQNITNVVTEQTNTYFIIPILFSSTTVSISADVIEFFDSTSVVMENSNFIRPESRSLNNSKMFSYQNINFVQIGDSVLINSPFSNNEFNGRIIGKVSENDVLVRIMTKNNTIIEQTLPYKHCRKIMED